MVVLFPKSRRDGAAEGAHDELANAIQSGGTGSSHRVAIELVDEVIQLHGGRVVVEPGRRRWRSPVVLVVDLMHLQGRRFKVQVVVIR